MPDAVARIYGPALLPAAAATIYTVPAATVVTLTSIIVCNNHTGPVDFTLSIGSDAPGTRLFRNVLLQPGQTLLFSSLGVIMTATQILQAYASVASQLSITISGVLST